MPHTEHPLDTPPQVDQPKPWQAPPPGVSVLLQPGESQVLLAKVRTVRAVLTALELRPGMAIVARRGELLTPDRPVWPGDELLVRRMMSSG